MKYNLAIKYLPHLDPMVMIQDVHLVDEQNCVCSVRVDKTGILTPFLNSQFALPNFYAIELMAQTIGVWNGYRGMKTNHQAKLGMLLGARAIKMNTPQFPLNSLLMIYAKLVFSDEKLANFDCQIKIANRCVSSGKLNVYEPDDIELKTLFSDKRLGKP